MQRPKRSICRLILPVIFALLVRASSAQTPERFHQVVQPYADAQMFMGSVLVAKNGKILFSKSYGMADLEWGVPDSSTTRFNIASMTKQFTAASILLLEERGKLRTDDLVKKFIPDAPPAWDKITIYHLLTHTSGISNSAATYEPGPPEKLVLHDAPLNSQPGEKWEYTNLGYIVLGYLVEKISGETYEEFVQENIFKPLAMKDSGLISFVTVIPRRATGYWPGNSGIENADRPDPRYGFSAGALYSSTEDLLRWEEGIFGGKLLTPASLRKMTTPFKSDYGCGLYVHRVSGHLVIEHDGNNIGFNADMAYYPEEKLAVIVLANLNGTVTGEMTKALAAVAHGQTPPIPSIHKEITLSKGVLARYAGTYRFPQYILKMVPEGNHLLVKFDNGGTLAVFPESETKFFSKPWPTQFQFSQNGSGEFTVLTRYEGEKEEKGAKE
ncbi:MAG TPA: serine hydrolase [Candidatus Dormibacteraeota bacterium]|nr:serine hydrolase [Candidatus Dormibacteraeota bacterium]